MDQTASQTVTLRRLSLSDADMYYDIFDDNRDFIRSHDSRLADGLRTISSVAEQLSPYNASHRYHFAIEEQDKFVGSTALFMKRGNGAELTYWLDRRSTGRGIGIEACRMTIEYAFHGLQVNQVDAVVAPNNIRSVKLATRLGFVPSIVLDEDIVYSLMR